MVIEKLYLEEVCCADAPGDVEALLPWQAIGALSALDSRRVMRALARDPVLSGSYAEICEERDAMAQGQECFQADDVEALGHRARERLFAAIDQEPGRGSTSTSSTVIRLNERSFSGRVQKQLADIA